MKIGKFIRKLQDISCISKVKIEGNIIKIYCDDEEIEKMKVIDDAIFEGKISKKIAKFALNRLQNYSNFQKDKIEQQEQVIEVLEEVINKLITLRNEMTE